MRATWASFLWPPWWSRGSTCDRLAAAGVTAAAAGWCAGGVASWMPPGRRSGGPATPSGRGRSSKGSWRGASIPARPATGSIPTRRGAPGLPGNGDTTPASPTSDAPERLAPDRCRARLGGDADLARVPTPLTCGPGSDAGAGVCDGSSAGQCRPGGSSSITARPARCSSAPLSDTPDVADRRVARGHVSRLADVGAEARGGGLPCGAGGGLPRRARGGRVTPPGAAAPRARAPRQSAVDPLLSGSINRPK